MFSTNHFLWNPVLQCLPVIIYWNWIIHGMSSRYDLNAMPVQTLFSAISLYSFYERYKYLLQVRHFTTRDLTVLSSSIVHSCNARAIQPLVETVYPEESRTAIPTVLNVMLARAEPPWTHLCKG